MRSRSTSFFGTASNVRITDCQDKHGPQPSPVAPRYSTGLQLALLELRNTELTRAVLAKLRNSTARTTPVDKAGLIQQQFAIHNGTTCVLTPIGVFRADQIARELGRQFELPQLTTRTATRRSLYEPGVKANFNFW